MWCATCSSRCIANALEGRRGEGGRGLGLGDAALVALGSNLGEPLTQLRRAGRELGELAFETRWSSLYETVPVGGPPGQPMYLNAVAVLWPRTALTDPHALLAALQAIELRQGRRRAERWGPRTLDLDLLACGASVLESAALTLPHPRMMQRGFVLAPLCEVAPDWRHPLTGETSCAALRRLGRVEVRRTRLSWTPR